ncbi:MAG: hypothetical protein ACKVVP_04725 [Chloroflexota bacterium]
MPQTIDARLGSWWVNPIVALTRCRIPISDIFAQSFISKGAYQQRDEDVVTMKSSLRNGTIPSDLFRTYQITLLHLECPSAPCLRIDDPAVSTLYRVEHPHIVVEVIEVRLP